MKKFVYKIIFFLACAMLALGVSCSRPGAQIEDIEKENPILVVFDYNGGKENNSDVKNVYCKENSLLLEPGYNDITYPAPTRSGYYLVGYFRGSKDGDGNVTYGEEWDFDTDRVTESITLYAKWEEVEYINVYYGDQVMQVEVSRDNGGVIDRLREPNWPDHTFLGFYFDEAYTQPVTFPFTYSEETSKVYAKFLEGDWVFVSTAADLRNIRYNDDVWLMNDIDMEGASFSGVNGVYEGEFNGNGYTISNITFSRSTSFTATTSPHLGMFSTLGEDAYIHDVTFENVTMEVTFQERAPAGLVNYLGLLAGTWQKGARVESVSVTGTITYDSSDTQREIVAGIYGEYTGENFDSDYPTLTYDVTLNDTNNTKQ